MRFYFLPLYLLDLSFVYKKRENIYLFCAV